MKLAVNIPSLVLNYGKIARSSRPLNLNHVALPTQLASWSSWFSRENWGEQEREWADEGRSRQAIFRAVRCSPTTLPQWSHTWLAVDCGGKTLWCFLFFFPFPLLFPCICLKGKLELETQAWQSDMKDIFWLEQNDPETCWFTDRWCVGLWFIQINLWLSGSLHLLLQRLSLNCASPSLKELYEWIDEVSKRETELVREGSEKHSAELAAAFRRTDLRSLDRVLFNSDHPTFRLTDSQPQVLLNWRKSRCNETSLERYLGWGSRTIWLGTVLGNLVFSNWTQLPGLEICFACAAFEFDAGGTPRSCRWIW